MGFGKNFVLLKESLYRSLGHGKRDKGNKFNRNVARGN